MGNLRETPFRFLPIALAAATWGLTPIFAKFALNEITPFALLALRSTLGFIILIPLAIFMHCPMLPASGEWLSVLGMGLTGIFLNNSFFFYAAQHTTATNIGVIIATSPLMTALLARTFLGEPLTKRRILGIAIAFIGAGLLVSKGDLAVLKSLSFNPGDIAELMAALSISTMAIITKKLHKTSAVTATMWCMIVATVLSLIMAVIVKEPVPDISALSNRAIIALLFMGILASGLAYVFQQVSIQWIGPAASVAFYNAQPAVSIIGAVFILHESISMIQVVSSVIIFCGIFLNAGSDTRNA